MLRNIAKSWFTKNQNFLVIRNKATTNLNEKEIENLAALESVEGSINFPLILYENMTI